MQVIRGLLQIKRVREASREAELRGARNQFELATGALRRAAELKEQRDQERTHRENSLYEGVCTRVVVVRELHELKFEVDVMKDQAKTDAQAVTDAQAQRQVRRQALEEATGSWRHAVRATQKFHDLSEQELEAEARHAEWQAEIELEDYPGRNIHVIAMQDSAEGA